MELDGEPLTVTEIAGGPRRPVPRRCRTGPGPLTVRYQASVTPAAPTQDDGEPADDAADPDALEHLRQSRYAPSDALVAFAERELAALPGGPGRAGAVADWVFERLGYVVGSSGPLDTAVDTLLAGEGVCRDFAHLTVALCRAQEIPARLVAVYAPGLSPMDFHAVVEARVEGRWQVLDPTRLRPAGAPGPHRHRPGRRRHRLPLHVPRPGRARAQRGPGGDRRRPARRRPRLADAAPVAAPP